MSLQWVMGLVFGIAATLMGCAADAGAVASRTLVNFGVKGGWCWFQDERAIVDGGKLIFGSVASPSGDVNVTTYDLASGKSVTVALHEKFQSDDHDAPAFLKLGDGRYLATYASHGGAGGVKGMDLMRWRISAEPGDATQWQPEQTLSVGAYASYTNTYRLSAENGRIYNFHRGLGFNPNYLISDDDGRTFGYGGRLLHWAAPDKSLPGAGRPYVRYASNNVDTIHFTTTEDHPRNYDNSLYHGFVRGGKICRSDGTVVGDLSTTKDTAVKPTDLTCIFKGDADNVAWCSDIRMDAQGRPRIAFSVQKDSGIYKYDDRKGGDDIRYHYARWDGAKWNQYEIAYAGSRLYVPEVDYSGLVALHPGNPDLLYISTNADPVTGKPLISGADQQRHREIFRGVTADGGRTWKWTALTSNSPVDNIRPICRVISGDKAMVIWQRGTYKTYTNFDMNIVGVID